MRLTLRSLRPPGRWSSSSRSTTSSSGWTPTAARSTPWTSSTWSASPTTRGLNRWIALKQVLDLLRDRAEVAERGFVVPEATQLQRFLDSPYPLSDTGIAAFAKENPSEEIERAIRWGNGVNAAIADMVHNCGPFVGVREAFQAMQPDIDCMTVSATPGEALIREWNEHGLAHYVKAIAGQGVRGLPALGGALKDRLGQPDLRASRWSRSEPATSRDEGLETTPVEPVETTPVEPVETTPVQPVETTPVQPVETTPVEPVETTPVEPVETSARETARTSTEARTNQPHRRRRRWHDMPTLVDLTASPYGLDDAQLAWVEQTLAGMPDEEKVGQVFVNLFHFGTDMFSGNDLTNAEILAKYHMGGARYHGGDSEKVQGLLNQLQADSKIPLLVAATCDAGGNGACSDGTYIASGAQCEASGDEEVAYNAGLGVRA